MLEIYRPCVRVVGTEYQSCGTAIYKLVTTLPSFVATLHTPRYISM